MSRQTDSAMSKVQQAIIHEVWPHESGLATLVAVCITKVDGLTEKTYSGQQYEKEYEESKSTSDE